MFNQTVVLWNGILFGITCVLWNVACRCLKSLDMLRIAETWNVGMLGVWKDCTAANRFLLHNTQSDTVYVIGNAGLTHNQQISGTTMPLNKCCCILISDMLYLNNAKDCTYQECNCCFYDDHPVL
ncbi:hypothetical protein RTP6_001841 [Batrachochytrium dendrobatidis]